MDEKDPLVHAGVRIRTDQFVAIKQLGLNFSEWVRKKFDDEFMSVEEIDKDIKEKAEELEKLNKRKQIIVKKQEDSKEIPDEEIDFLIDTKKTLELNPHFVEGRIKLYLNRFRKPYNLSKAEFYGLLEMAEDKLMEKQTVKQIEVRV